jgi:phosphate transport system substrate-binding protein
MSKYHRSRRGWAFLGGVAALAALALAVTSYAFATTSVKSAPARQASQPHFNTPICKKGGIRPILSNPIKKLGGGAKTLSGAGATFPAPMISVWTSTYASKTGVQVAYQSIGSGGGVNQIIAKTVDFGQSDVPMTNAELARAPGKILHIPIVLGAVVISYHLKGIATGLKFDGETIGKIFAGKITKWNDKALKKLNPGVPLPNKSIAVVHRSDGSGTTGVFTDFLTKTSPTWVKTLGGKDKSRGKTVAWPVGIGGKGNEGVSALVGQTEGGIGYVELQYAIAQHLKYGQVKNRAGLYTQPCMATITAAAGKVHFPPDLRAGVTWRRGRYAYPIAGTSFALVYQNQTSKAIGHGLINYFSWVLTIGQRQCADVNYAPLGSALRKQALDQLYKMTLNGKKIL